MCLVVVALVVIIFFGLFYGRYFFTLLLECGMSVFFPGEDGIRGVSGVEPYARPILLRFCTPTGGRHVGDGIRETLGFLGLIDKMGRGSCM